MRAYVYVDGLNLYYGALKNTPFKWLNLATLCSNLLPHDSIARIKYYTAIVHSRPGDPGAPTRQQFYLRALKTIPNLEVYYGHFLTEARWLPLVGSASIPPKKARVYKTEEKGSDVNLATHLVRDGFNREYEVAVLITNDSDLLEPIRVVRYELGLPVGILNPHPVASKALLPHATFFKQICKRHLARCQFPQSMLDASGSFSKPRTW